MEERRGVGLLVLGLDDNLVDQGLEIILFGRLYFLDSVGYTNMDSLVALMDEGESVAESVKVKPVVLFLRL